jgi:hypothetical protein
MGDPKMNVFRLDRDALMRFLYGDSTCMAYSKVSRSLQVKTYQIMYFGDDIQRRILEWIF